MHHAPKHPLILALLGFTAGCALAAAPALADDTYNGHGTPPHPVQHAPAPPPQRGWTGGGSEHFNSDRFPGAPHFQPRDYYSQHAPVYHPPSYGEHPSPYMHGYPQVRSVPHPAWQDEHRGSGHFAPPSDAARRFAHGPTISREHAAAFRAFTSFRGRRISALGERERESWRHGTWRHMRYHGRYGWWWYTNGGWFFYDEPVYPYPLFISDYGYEDYDDYADGDGYGYGDVAYWCAWPRGYYPEVQWCSVPWQPVPAY